MSDQQDPQEHEQLDLLSLEDRVRRELAVLFGRHGLVNRETGSTDLVAIADMIYPTVSQAVADSPGDRAGIDLSGHRRYRQDP